MKHCVDALYLQFFYSRLLSLNEFVVCQCKQIVFLCK